MPRKHIERIVIGSDEEREERGIKLGAWISNQRSRVATLSAERIEKLSAERIEKLSAIGMRWT